VANQRPHISLIDRRHFDDAALPVGMLIGITTNAYVKREAVARLLTALSHINVRTQRRATAICRLHAGGHGFTLRALARNVVICPAIPLFSSTLP